MQSQSLNSRWESTVTADSTEYVTTECPNGHRVRGDAGWLHREVRCPHCQTKFRFDRPGTTAAVVTDASDPSQDSAPSQVEPRSLSDTGVLRIIDSFGKPVLPEDDGRTRHCSNCGAVYPSSISICYGCNIELDPPVDETATDAAGGAAGIRDSVEFQPVDESPFENISISAVMRPRKAIIALNVADSLVETLDRVREFPHTCYPVASETGDRFVGWVSIERILMAESNDFDLRKLARPMTVMAQSKPVSRVLPLLHRTKSSFVLIADEADRVVGMVTAKDVLLGLVK
ncbi:CBS domain-containing protein [Rhodopirellula sp. JC639]|uniref:CBS domain-containing protein n=1 Tax=Stieleria mannarensis TaxID=2755585 RepID=UPI001601AAD4|nr:CBS domain-containing protein [Rhodopirellula sp. JC639]